MRSGDSFTRDVLFSTGAPDALVTWTLLDGNGDELDTDTIDPAADAVSVTILISGTLNTLPADTLFEYRELRWSYTVDSEVVSDSVRYRIEAFLKFGVSPNGVRAKLGLKDFELPDEDIDLVFAYASFQNTVTEAAMDAVVDPYPSLQVTNAIEALAGLALLESLPLKLAEKEVSGTSQFQRSEIDWEALRVRLNETVAAGITAVDPTLVLTDDYGSIFVAAVRPDPIIGES